MIMEFCVLIHVLLLGHEVTVASHLGGKETHPFVTMTRGIALLIRPFV